MTETTLVSDDRDVRATLDSARGDDIDDAGEIDDTDDTAVGRDAVVIACPPHPQRQGRRGDAHLVAVSDALTTRGVDYLRFDYGAWNEGYGERADALRAVEWAAKRYDHVGLFGLSFGGAMALLAATEGADVGAVSALGPTGRLAGDLDAVAVLDRIPVPVQVVCGTRDDIADWKLIVERAREYHQPVVEFAVDHFFVGQEDKIATTVADFLVSNFGVEREPKRAIGSPPPSATCDEPLDENSTE